jgi:predicted N-acetyltransferase YhbS
MAPVAVRTSFQKKGVGQAVIAGGLEQLRARGVQLVMSYGDINFYAKAGFTTVAEETVPAPLPLSYPEGWIGQSLDGREITPVTGGTHCVPAIDNGAYW